MTAAHQNNDSDNDGRRLPQECRLEPKVMGVLVCLAGHAGEVVSKETLLQTVWPDTFVSEDGLKRCISELRRVFEDDAREPRIIETIPKRGYRLITRVEPVEGTKEFSGLVGLLPFHRASRLSTRTVDNKRETTKSPSATTLGGTFFLSAQGCWQVAR